jgi:hypothetical protein
MTGIYPGSKTPAVSRAACFIGDLAYDAEGFVLRLSLKRLFAAGMYPGSKTPADNRTACFIGDLAYDVEGFVLRFSPREVMYGRNVS